MKYPAPDAPAFEDSLAMAREFIQKWKGHTLIVPSVAPHAPYSVDKEQLALVAELAEKLDVPVLIHLSETKDEIEQIRKQVFGSNGKVK